MKPHLSLRLRTTHFLASLAALTLLVSPLTLQPAAAQSVKPTIVLIHGAWADASSWNTTIAPLEAAGYTVYAPPNPLRSLASDAASVTAFLKTIPGPVVLVGHSYGGAVISAASAASPNVKALVFIDAFAPDAGESALSLLASAPPPPNDFFTPVPLTGSADGDVDIYLTRKYYAPAFASDVPAPQAAVLAAEERPITLRALNEKATAAEGWKTIPSWYVVGDADHAIPPSIQMMMATRAKSHITHVNGSHPSMIEHPEATVNAIEAAAASIK